MANPQNPLTQTPAPTLDWSREGAPASSEYDDIYFSVDGGLAETKAVFLDGCHLPEAWETCEIFNVFELGFGSGLNFLACWELWQKTALPDQKLHFISVEAFPWTKEDLNKALRKFPSLGKIARQLIDIWPGRVKGVHRLHFGPVSLTLFHMPVDEALGSYAGPEINAWFLDGFSPSKNPEMWSQTVFYDMAKISTSKARVGTFTVAGPVRRGLEQAGFSVTKCPGFGRKRERLEAVFNSTKMPARNSNNKFSPIIIGGGIAGAAIAQSFLRRNITPIVIDKEMGLQTAASGNPAAMVMPRLDLQDRPESRFFLSAYLYAVREYNRTGNIMHKGAVHLARSADEALRFEKISQQSPLPVSELQPISTEGAAAKLGIPVAHKFSGLYFPAAVTINPKEIIAAWLAGADQLHASAMQIKKVKDVWQVLDETGELLAQSDSVFMAAGADILQLNAPGKLAVRFTRGQISWGSHHAIPALPVNYSGYALKLNDGILLGATHAHVGTGQSTVTKPEDDDKNNENYAAFTGGNPIQRIWNSRASVRVTTKDTLPISTQLKPGLFLMTGLGSRGFMMAPLLGEALVCQALNEPLPICSKTKMRFGTREKI